MSLITQLFNLLYPPRCPSCGAMVAHDGDWCPACLAAIWHPRRINKTPAVRHLSACYCLTDYRGAMRHVLHDIKYNGKPGSARPAGSCSTASLAGTVRPHRRRRPRAAGTGKITAPRLSARPKPSFATGPRPAGPGATPCSACGRRKSNGSSGGTSGPRTSTMPLPSKKPSTSIKTHPPRRRHLHDWCDLRSLRSCLETKKAPPA